MQAKVVKPSAKEQREANFSRLMEEHKVDVGAIPEENLKLLQSSNGIGNYTLAHNLVSPAHCTGKDFGELCRLPIETLRKTLEPVCLEAIRKAHQVAYVNELARDPAKKEAAGRAQALQAYELFTGERSAALIDYLSTPYRDLNGREAWERRLDKIRSMTMTVTTEGFTHMRAVNMSFVSILALPTKKLELVLGGRCDARLCGKRGFGMDQTRFQWFSDLVAKTPHEMLGVLDLDPAKVGYNPPGSPVPSYRSVAPQEVPAPGAGWDVSAPYVAPTGVVPFDTSYLKPRTAIFGGAVEAAPAAMGMSGLYAAIGEGEGVGEEPSRSRSSSSDASSDSDVGAANTSKLAAMFGYTAKPASGKGR